MSANSGFGLSQYYLPLYALPAVDYPAASITAVYPATFAPLQRGGIFLILSNYTDQMLDYSLDGGKTTTGHLAPNQILSLPLKTNLIVQRADYSVLFKANSTLPTTLFASVTILSAD